MTSGKYLDLRILLILSCLCGVLLARTYHPPSALTQPRMVCRERSATDDPWPPRGLTVNTGNSIPVVNPHSYDDWYDVCSTLGSTPNAGCVCDVNDQVICPSNIFLQGPCQEHCGCRKSDDETDQEILDAIPVAEPYPVSDNDENAPSEPGEQTTATGPPPFEPLFRPPSWLEDTCSSTCTSVTQACSNGKKCGCLALPLNPFTFWRKAACGPRRSVAKSIIIHTGLRKREKLLGHRGLSLLPIDGNRTLSHNISSNVTEMTPAQRSTMAYLEEIADGIIPAPCNASYVSYACADSADGIVHETEDKWLGALLPENATKIPPIPRRWLQINGITNLTGIQVSDG